MDRTRATKARAQKDYTATDKKVRKAPERTNETGAGTGLKTNMKKTELMNIKTLQLPVTVGNKSIREI